ncbi:MAG: hotdog domain-containing protein [Dysgonamonadaceae bacterium]
MDTKLVMSDKTQITNYHLVRGMDLNHHGTLFAGKAALLFVEAGFIVTSLALNTNEIVCLRIHGMLFSHPVKSGDTIRLASQIVYAGKSSVGVYVEVYVEASNTFVVDGFLTFVRVDEETGKPIPHGLILEVNSEKVKLLQEKYLQEKRK